MTPASIESIAKGLTKAMWDALRDAEVVREEFARLVFRHLYSPTIAGLERRGLVTWSGLLTSDGLSVRQYILEQEQGDG